MKSYSKEEVKQVFGENGFINRRVLAGKIGYLSGILPFDEAKLLSNPKKGSLMNFDLRPNGLLLEALKNFSYIRVGLPTNSIQYFVIEPQAVIIEKKEKSVVGRAIVGGLLLGPLGAVVGGLSGVGSKDVKVSDNLPENIMTMACLEEGVTHQFVFAIENKNLKEVSTFLDTHFPGLLKPADEVNETSIDETKPKVSLADELIKLKSLLDSGVLSQAEFDMAKAKVLQ